MDKAVSIRLAEIHDLAIEIQKRLQGEVTKLGLDINEVRLKSVDDASYRLDKDPANGEYSLVGDWRDEKGTKLGSLLFHPDGSFFVEHDVIKIHPTDKRWFIEAVNAWGKGETIKSEARLLPSMA